MFDIGFSELALIGVVALVVLGPERLPRVARTAGHLLGRFQRYVSQVKSDINREMDLADLKKMRTEVEEAARGIESSVTATFGEARQEVESAGSEIRQAGEQIQQATSGVNLMAGWPGTSGESVDTKPPEAPASVEAPQPQMELGLDAPQPGETRRD